MRFMDWLNINEHTDVVSWKPFGASAVTLVVSFAVDFWQVADIWTSVLIKIGQLIVVIFGVYIAAHNAYTIHKKKNEKK